MRGAGQGSQQRAPVHTLTARIGLGEEESWEGVVVAEPGMSLGMIWGHLLRAQLNKK